VESLPSKKKDPKKKEQELKRKEVKPQLKSSMFQKEKRKKEDKIYKLLGEILLKERRSRFPIMQNPMCGLFHTHTSFAFALPSIP
jgi:hypothetical protein